LKKNIVKIILDIVMALLLILMYSKNVISMTFHELGGLIACGIFIIHMALNWKWVVGVTKRFFDLTLPVKTIIGYIVNVLLFFSVSFIAVSGIMISKTLFPGSGTGGMFWKTGHYFMASCALILVGIHLGLHWPFIRGMFAKLLKLPRKIAKPAGILLLAAVIVFGAWSLASTSFTGWLSAPFSSQGARDGGAPEGMLREGELPEGFQADGQAPGGFAGQGDQGSGTGSQTQAGKGGFSFGSSVSVLRIVTVIGSFGSISCLFAAAVVWLEQFGKWLKKRNLSRRQTC
jgi:hypothetical protein